MRDGGFAWEGEAPAEPALRWPVPNGSPGGSPSRGSA